MGLERIQLVLPEGAIVRQPRIEFLQALCPQLIDAALLVLLHIRQARLAQDAQMT